MKKKIAVLLCVLALIVVCTMAAAAEDSGGDMIWDFWKLLSGSNVNYLGILGTLITSLVTMFRVISGTDGLKNFFSWLLEALKKVIPSA